MLKTEKKKQRKYKRQPNDTYLLTNTMLTKNCKPDLYSFIYKCHHIQ